MCKNNTAILAAFLTIVAGVLGPTTAQDPKQVTCTGKVIDYEGRVVGNVKVTLYERSTDAASDLYDLKLIKETTTDTEGAFSFTINARGNIFVYGSVVAEKEDLAPGCAYWDMKGDTKCQIELSRVGELSGCVVDETDKPIEQAEVSLYMLTAGDGDSRQYVSGQLASMLYTVDTDNAGRFTFTNIPADAKVDLLVRKAGRATITTYVNSSSLHYSPGQSDIKLVQPVEAKIEGVCVERNSGKPLGGQKLMVMRAWNQPLLGHEPVVSKEDGTFTVSGLAAGKCILELATPRQGLAEWAAEPVELTNETGKTISDLKMELSKGGILEIAVRDARDKRPLDDASISVRELRNNVTFNIRSVEDGVARIRLTPGHYRISSVAMQGYASARRSQDMITIEAGKTNSLEYELAVRPKITGVVRDDEGRPLKDVRLSIWPFGFEKSSTNAEGKFEIEWDPESSHAGTGAMRSLIARHEERNLSANTEIDVKTRTIDIKLQPGVSLMGKVVDATDKAVEGAKMTVMMRALNLGASLKPEPVLTDAEGNFEVRAVPEGIRYSISLGADGYSSAYKDIDIQQAEDGKLDLGTFTLRAANLTVSGVVVDENDKPVSDVRVVSSGRNQPSDSVQTDADGKFKLKACEGRVEIRANSTGRPVLSGSVVAEGGATDIRIIISERMTSYRYAEKQMLPLVGRPLPDIKNLNLQISAGDIENKRVLVCFFDMNQRPSRNCISQLAQQTKSLEDRGVIIVGVQTSKVEEAAPTEWVKKNDVPFPVGVIRGDEEQTRFAWGVRSLPWLILTDRNHVVIAEGFSLNELDEKLKSNNGG